MTDPINPWIIVLAALAGEVEKARADLAREKKRNAALAAENNRLRWTRTHIPRWEDLPDEVRDILQHAHGGFFAKKHEAECALDELREAFEWAASRVGVAV